MFRTALFATLLAASAAAPAFAQQPAPAGAYKIDPTHASVVWRISHFGLSNYTARFTKFDADLRWNPSDPAQSALTATIDPTSVRTDFPFPDKEDFDAAIGKTADFLNGQPIRFVATRLTTTSGKNGQMSGDLTFRGATHPMTFDVTFNGSQADNPMEHIAKVGFSARGLVHRADWGLVFAGPALGADVEVIIEAEFVPAP